MIFLVLFVFSVISVVGLGLLAAQADFRGMIIPNRYAVFITLFFGIAWLAAHNAGASIFAPLSSHLLSAGIALAVTFVFFIVKFMGGGDSKLITAYAFWTPAQMLPIFLFYVTFLGGMFALVSLVLKKWKPVKEPRPGSWLARLQSGESVIPYGIPIVMGALFTFLILGYFSPEKLMLFLSVPD